MLLFFQESITITLLAGIPNYLLDRLKNPHKKNQNNTECIVFKSTKHCHVSPFLHSLHRLPITRRIDYKLSSLCFSVNNGTGSKYLSELLTIYTPSRQLRSAADTELSRIPAFNTKTNGQRSFFISSRFCLEQSPLNC